MKEYTNEDNCLDCGHVLSVHLLTAYKARDGGIMTCDHDGCNCIKTWSVPYGKKPTIWIQYKLIESLAFKRGYTQMWIDYMMDKLTERETSV